MLVRHKGGVLSPPEPLKSRIFGSADAGNDTPAQQQRLTAEPGAIQGWQKQR